MIVACAFSAAVACGEPEADVESTALEASRFLDPLLVEPVVAEQDPLASHRPDPVDCPPAAWGPEGGGFEIQTGACNYAAFDQPLPEGAKPGDELVVTLWHDLLDAPEPATAHFAIWVADRVLWEGQVPIPAPSNTLEARVVLEAPLPERPRLGLHLHNHGYNSWRWVEAEHWPKP